MHLVVANMCIIFGLAMLDVITIEFTWFARFGSPKTEGKGGLTALLIGGSSALISGPCTAPVLAILLTYVGTKQNVLFGISMLFSYALGMGFLLIIIGTFTGLISSLPQSGQWMVRIKKAFGFLMIAVGQYFLVKAGQFMI
jgi:thiol:disulfide interchange protein DsbD